MFRRRHTSIIVMTVALALGACTTASVESEGEGGAGGMGGEGGTEVIGENASIAAFSGAHVFWTGWDDGQNAREIDATVTFPEAAAAYQNVTMSFALSCPNNRCDPWDRYGSLAVVKGAGTDAEEVIEISRFITPFGVGAAWEADVTDLRPTLSGDVTLRVFIDTWVGPGGPYGDGWLVDVSFDLVGGIPERRAVANVPVWERQGIVFGDPARPVAMQVPGEAVTFPEASSFALRTFITGHGQGNLFNCAEFCEQDHTFAIAGVPYTRAIWRDDCTETGAPNQQGTWQFARAGWCPGAIAHPWTLELQGVSAGSLDIAYDVSAYENTCRPDSATCMGCVAGNTCEYNDSGHTEPSYQMSAILIGYE